MKNLNFITTFLVLFNSSGQSKSFEQLNVFKFKPSIFITQANPINKQEAVAYFAEGCFWHSEIVFQSLVGVKDAVSGYAGGTDPNPDYEKVSGGSTGHAETIAVYYDTTVINFKTLVEAFFASQDPTTLNRQGNDKGTEYRSIAFYKTPEEKQIIDTEIKKLTDEKKYLNKIVTEVKQFKNFLKAENYHQEYIRNNPGNSYVKNVSIPEFLEFKKHFKGNFKKQEFL